MTHNIGVLMDPIGSINPKKDSTLAMLVAAQERGWKINYMEQADLFLDGGNVHAKCKSLEVYDNLDNWFQLGKASKPDHLDIVLMRKDPPFDMEYIYTTYLLERLEGSDTLVVNRPASIRDCNEKLFATEFPECCPPHLVTRDAELLKHFHNQHKDVIFKPLDGMGGSSIFRIAKGDPNVNVIIETLTLYGKRQIMAQKYIPEIKDGDTRILLINGEPIPFGLARIPASGETRGNLAAGATGVGRELTERDRFICDQVGPTLRSKGLYFVGIDVIGDYLTEINVTCPTCIRELNQAFDLDIAGDLMDFISSKVLAG